MDGEGIGHGNRKGAVEDGAGVEGEVGVWQGGETGALHDVSGTAENVSIEHHTQIEDAWGGGKARVGEGEGGRKMRVGGR